MITVNTINTFRLVRVMYTFPGGLHKPGRNKRKRKSIELQPVFMRFYTGVYVTVVLNRAYRYAVRCWDTLNSEIQ